MKRQPFDFALIGGGIVGVSTAWQLKKRHPDAKVILIEKEGCLAAHQTGRNSGVIHAGVYYQPGSLKADFCKRGAAETISFCQENGIPYTQCGKLLVATNQREFDRMGALEKRCAVNKIDTQRLNARELKEIEPNIVGIGALLVPATGITDYKSITCKMAQHFLNSGGIISTGTEVRAMSERHGAVQIDLDGDHIESRYVVACGGLMADRLARMMHIDIEFMIIPFRGEYFQLSSHLNHIVTHLIYPIPDPDLPFLGVHLTRMINGTVTVGPNAVLGWEREGYKRVNLNFRDIAEMIRFPGFWKTVGHNFKSGMAEMIDSVFKAGYLKRIHKYCPHIALGDLNPYPVGIRAQAVKTDGTLVHDFLFAASERSLHVCNAPSPAATSAIPIGTYLCDKVTEQFKLS